MNKRISGQYRTQDARAANLGSMLTPMGNPQNLYLYAQSGMGFGELVALTLADLTKRLDLKWERKESPYLIGFLHDLCKVDAYRKTESGYEYNPDMLLTGHGEKSVILTLQHIRLTDEEIMCIRYHMGAYEGSEIWNNLGQAIRRYPNILWTHTADMMASQVMEV